VRLRAVSAEVKSSQYLLKLKQYLLRLKAVSAEIKSSFC
jgi:hypothetical protein